MKQLQQEGRVWTQWSPVGAIIQEFQPMSRKLTYRRRSLHPFLLLFLLLFFPSLFLPPWGSLASRRERLRWGVYHSSGMDFPSGGVSSSSASKGLKTLLEVQASWSSLVIMSEASHIRALQWVTTCASCNKRHEKQTQKKKHKNNNISRRPKVLAYDA